MIYWVQLIHLDIVNCQDHMAHKDKLCNSMEKLLRVKHQRLLVQSLLLLSSSSFGKEKDHHLMIKMETQLSLKEQQQKEHHLKEPEHHLKEQEHHHKGQESQETEEDNQQLVQEVHHLKDNLLYNKDDQWLKNSKATNEDNYKYYKQQYYHSCQGWFYCYNNYNIL